MSFVLVIREPGKEDFGESSYGRMLPNRECGDREMVELELLEKKQHLVVENELFPCAAVCWNTALRADWCLRLAEG